MIKSYMILMVLLGGACAMFGQDTWLKVFCANGNQVENYNVDIGYSVASTIDDAVVVVGKANPVYGEFSKLIKGKTDAVVVKLSSTGSVIWQRTIGGLGNDYANSVATCPNGDILITGGTDSFSGDFNGPLVGTFVVKLDKDGNVQWIKTYGGNEGRFITSTSDDGIIVTASEKQLSYSNVLAMKLDKDGSVLWKSAFAGTGNDWVTSHVNTSDNGVIITGSTKSNDGDFTGMNKGGTDFFAIKLDRDGRLQWKRNIGGQADEGFGAVAATTDGNFVLTGSTYSIDGDFDGMPIDHRAEVVVVKIDTTGSILWKKYFGGTYNDLGISIATKTDGSILVTGCAGSADGDFIDLGKRGDFDIFVLQLDAQGNLLRKRLYGGTNWDNPYSIATTSYGEVLVTGFTCSVDFDFKRNCSATYDIFVIKLDTDSLYPDTSTIEDTTSSTPLLIAPNPLSPSSTIQFALDNPSHVRIDLLNALGQAFEFLFNGYSDSGTHTLPLDISSLTSGVFWVRMTTDTGVQTAQVSLVK